MSPLMGIVALMVIAGTAVCVTGLVRRKRRLALIGSPAVVLLAWWLFAIARAPDPEAQFAQLFGAANRSVVSDIETSKPMSMDGNFLSFHIRQADFDARLRKKFSDKVAFGDTLLQGQALPKGWPEWIEHGKYPLLVAGELGDDRVFLVFDAKSEKAFASVEYPQW